jgi:hypothetical protein
MLCSLYNTNFQGEIVRKVHRLYLHRGGVLHITTRKLQDRAIFLHDPTTGNPMRSKDFDQERRNAKDLAFQIAEYKGFWIKGVECKRF